MNHQVLFAVCTLLAVHVSCAAVEPEELQYSDPEPLQILKSYEEIDMIDALPRRGLLFTGTHNRAAIADTVLVQRVTYTGRESTWFSGIRGVQVGANQNAVAEVIAGGVGWNTVTVEIKSARGRGFNVQIDVYGRF